MTTPSDAPPSYEQITGSSSGAGAGSSRRPTETSTSSTTFYKERNGIPGLTRRSMEDEGRPLPYGWIRQYDPDNHHQFFVNTNVEPPKSVWHHPYDDEEYMNSLDPIERKKIQGMKRVPSEADIEAESSDDDEGHHHSHSMKAAAGTAVLPPRPSGAEQSGGVTKFGRRMKDKMTGTTHEQRERKRIQRAEEERRTYQRHMELRQAMSRAAQTGQPQFIGKDHNGRDVYIEPPQGAGPPQGAYGYNPYQQGPYANPNATFIRPQYPYSRPYGGGYGGGFGLPLAGGLMGGALLGGLLF
ncbi:hypothetical protein N7G274_004989 [Stereocaulon virgatum]|uniref:WW domain-containing protein n=1 Tax=Stereocaulon virgatum TaxID=373712 RepID=A0ABR4ACA9_9LECA